MTTVDRRVGAVERRTEVVERRAEVVGHRTEVFERRTEVVERRTEVRALSELGLTELGKASTGIHETHRAVSDRIFGAVRWGVGPAVAPVKAVHDAITDGVYLVVAESMATAGKVGGLAGDLPLKRSPSTTKAGAAIIAALNGLIGDELDARQSPLADPMSVRVGGRPVPLTGDGIAAAFPGATGRIVVALHGLVETEYSWSIGEAEPYARDSRARASPPSSSATTPGAASPPTAATSPNCSTNSSADGRSRSRASACSGTRWAVWSRAARRTTGGRPVTAGSPR